MGLSATLNAARLGLSTNQLAIDVTATNVTNVNTPGYVRQRPEFEATGSIDVKAKSIQVGVDIQQVQRIYDRYLESQIICSASRVFSTRLPEGVSTICSESFGHPGRICPQILKAALNVL
jgi:flagellar hook-associated protein 1 FlgK